MLFALNFMAILWQARGLERTVNVRFDSLIQIMTAKFETAHVELTRVEQIMDARLKHLEER